LHAAPRPPSPVPRPVYDTDVGRVEFACLLLEQFGVRMGGERRDAEPLALAPEHLEGRAPDRAGRAQDRDAQAHATPNRRNRPAVSGSTKYRESSRSRDRKSTRLNSSHYQPSRMP